MVYVFEFVESRRIRNSDLRGPLLVTGYVLVVISTIIILLYRSTPS